jgi:hypothetical protein
MKMLLCLVLFIFLASAGCAPGYKSMTKAQGEKEWQTIMQNDPDYNHIWAEESGR